MRRRKGGASRARYAEQYRCRRHTQQRPSTYPCRPAIDSGLGFSGPGPPPALPCHTHHTPHATCCVCLAPQTGIATMRCQPVMKACSMVYVRISAQKNAQQQPASLVPRRRSTHSSSALTRPRNSSSSACEEAAACLLVGLGSRDRRRPGLIFVASELPWPALECARTNQPLCSCDETTIRRNGTAQYPISSSVDFQIEWNGVIDLAQSSSVLLQRLAVNWQVSNVYRKGLPLGQLIVVSNRVAVPERTLLQGAHRLALKL